MRKRSVTLSVFTAAVLVLALTLAGLIAEAQRPAPTNVRVVLQPLANFTPILIARDKGYFGEENLNVTWTTITQAAVAVEAVYGGSAEFGGGGILEPIVARGNGLDVMFAVANCQLRSEPPHSYGLYVRDADPIRKPADLVGKRVSAGLINSVGYVHTLEWLRRNNVDPKGIQFLELPLPQMHDALLNNRIDAGWIVEPFVQILAQAGKGRALAYPYHENIKGMDITHYIAKESWLNANGDVARRFKRAIDKATTHLNTVPKEERVSWVAKFSGVKPELAEKMVLPVYVTEINVQHLQGNAEIAQRHGLLKQVFDVKTMVWRP
jgi:NitT/TauT family transport system substrate-binding protein